VSTIKQIQGIFIELFKGKAPAA